VDEPKFFVLIEVGCLECHEPTWLYGIFTDGKRARKLKDDAGSERFILFEVEELDTIYEDLAEEPFR